MNYYDLESDFYETFKSKLIDIIDSCDFVSEFNKSHMKCTINHFFDLNDFDSFGGHTLTLDEFFKYYKNHQRKYSSEDDVKEIIWRIKNDTKNNN